MIDNKIYILLAMIFCHIVDDYYLQGALAKFKQKSWWEENYPAKMYKYDYIIALLEHAFSWTFMMMLPLFIANYMFGYIYDTEEFVILFIANLIVHSIIDYMKANMKIINLTVDQLLHILQIIITWLLLIV